MEDSPFSKGRVECASECDSSLDQVDPDHLRNPANKQLEGQAPIPTSHIQNAMRLESENSVTHTL
jgi:hypothetical protein